MLCPPCPLVISLWSRLIRCYWFPLLRRCDSARRFPNDRCLHCPFQSRCPAPGSLRCRSHLDRFFLGLGVCLVMLTSLGAQGDAERLRAVGFDAYLTRPTRPSQLASVISAVWSVKRHGVREVFVTRHTLDEARLRKKD